METTTFRCTYRVTCIQYELEAPGDERLNAGSGGFREDESDQRYRVTLSGNPFHGDLDRIEMVMGKEDLAFFPFGADVTVEIAAPVMSDDAREITRLKSRFLAADDAANFLGGSVEENRSRNPDVARWAIELAELLCRGPGKDRLPGVR